MEDAQKSILAKWKACLEEEELFASVTASEAASMDGDGGEVSSKSSPRDFAAEIGALVAEEACEATISKVPSEVVLTDAAPTEVNPSEVASLEVPVEANNEVALSSNP